MTVNPPRHQSADELRVLSINEKQGMLGVLTYFVTGGVMLKARNLFQNGSFCEMTSFETNCNIYLLVLMSSCLLIATPIFAHS